MRIPINSDGVKCPYCGRANKPEAHCCFECGTPLPLPNSETEESSEEALSAGLKPDLDYSCKGSGSPGPDEIGVKKHSELQAEFWEQLPLKTEAELYDMLAHSEDYLSEAIAAAKEELRKRNLAPERVAQLEANAYSHLAEEQAKAQQRLGWPLRIVIFVFPLLPGPLLAAYYRDNGYKRKALDSWITLGVAVAFRLFARIMLDSAHRY